MPNPFEKPLVPLVEQESKEEEISPEEMGEMIEENIEEQIAQLEEHRRELEELRKNSPDSERIQELEEIIELLEEQIELWDELA